MAVVLDRRRGKKVEKPERRDENQG